MILAEYSSDIRELLPLMTGFQEFEDSFDLPNAEKSRRLAYKIITGSQGQLRKTEASTIPIIFDCELIERNSKKLLKLGIASIHDIQKVKLTLIYSEHEKKGIEASKSVGIQLVIMDDSDLRSHLSLLEEVKDVNGKINVKRTSIRMPQQRSGLSAGMQMNISQN